MRFFNPNLSKWLRYSLSLFVVPPIFICLGIFFNWFGSYQGSGSVVSIESIRNNSLQDLPDQIQNQNFNNLQILFGDLHVHTTFSNDAFMINLPIVQGEGSHPVADACNFARFCAGLDFFSVTDHAEWLTRREWKDTINSVNQCSSISNELDSPPVIPFIG